MPRLLGRSVKIIDVTTNEVTVIHVRGKNEERHPDASYTVPHNKDSRKAVDYIKLDKTQRKRESWLDRLFGRGDDSGDDHTKGGSSNALEFRW